MHASRTNELIKYSIFLSPLSARTFVLLETLVTSVSSLLPNGSFLYDDVQLGLHVVTVVSHHSTMEGFSFVGGIFLLCLYRAPNFAVRAVGVT